MNQVNWKRVLESSLKNGRNPEDFAKILKGVPAKAINWLPYGNDRLNHGTVRIATDPANALAERFTNGIDALLALRIKLAGIDAEEAKTWSLTRRTAAHLDTPRAAAAHYLRDILSNPKGNSLLIGELDPSHFTGDKKNIGFNRALFDIFDRGIGIPYDRLQTTILSLHQDGNKNDKSWLAGAFNQGASQSLGFAEYVLIVSRYVDSPYLAFTVVRLQEATEESQQMYVYMTNSDGTIPFIEVPWNGKDTTTSKGSSVPVRTEDFSNGTLVRHVGYDLHEYNDRYSNPKSMYRALTKVFFNPLAPFKLFEYTNDSKRGWIWDDARRNVIGSLAALEDVKAAEGSKVEYASPIEILNLEDERGSLGSVNYRVFVMKTPEGKERPYRGMVVNPSRPVVVDYNGQVQGELALSDLSSSLTTRSGNKPPIYSLLPHDMVIYINVDALTNRALNILSSNREGHMRKTQVFDILRKQIADEIANDPKLLELEDERRSKLNARGNDDSEKQLNEFLSNIVEKLLGSMFTGKFKSSGPSGPGTRTTVVGPRKKLTPIVTQNPPTYVKFVDDEVKFHPSQKRHLLIETDAADTHRIKVTTNTATDLDVKRITTLSKGRCRAIVSCFSKDIGADGILTVSVEGTKLSHTIPYEITKKQERETSDGPNKGKPQLGVVPYKRVPVSPADQAWNVLGLSDTDVNEYSFSFELAVDDSDGIEKLHVYYNTEFPFYKGKRDGLATEKHFAYESQYAAQAIVYAYRHFEDNTAVMDGEETTKVQRVERRAAATAFACNAEVHVNSSENTSLLERELAVGV